MQINMVTGHWFQSNKHQLMRHECSWTGEEKKQKLCVKSFF